MLNSVYIKRQGSRSYLSSYVQENFRLKIFPWFTWYCNSTRSSFIFLLFDRERKHKYVSVCTIYLSTLFNLAS